MAKAKIEKIDVDTYLVTETVNRITLYGEKIAKEERIVKSPIDIWIIGNTGVRNPWRIPSGFKAYAESNMIGHIREPEDQVAFKMLLLERGEIGGSLDRDLDASITRKYRLMFNKFGFTYPQIAKKDGFAQSELGDVDCITPLGRTFYNAESIDAQQECFLRGLVVPMEFLDKEAVFSPFLWVLSIMLELEKNTGETKINFIEFATCVQTSNPHNDVQEVVDDILIMREQRKNADNKKKFDEMVIDKRYHRYLKQKDNFKDYADMNIRYITASGIVRRSGRGIALLPEYHSLAVELIKGVTSTELLKTRLLKLCNGVALPTDDTEIAGKVLDDLIAELDYYNVSYTLPSIPLDSAKNINLVRTGLKKNIDQFKEEQYARAQTSKWEEIYEYLNLLIVNNGKEKELDEDYIIRVPKAEAAAYLEWILWRAFLALDHMISKPYEARRFHIDQDYLPVGTAPGGGPDMVFEFENYIIAVEVTMSTNSRQEAMEGEPVRRHVADLVMRKNKPVYGVFIANRIDSNTAETFRIGIWYNNQDERMVLNIVPFTLKQFANYFRLMFESKQATPDKFLSLFQECFDAKEGKEAPEWKLAINSIVKAQKNKII